MRLLLLIAVVLLTGNLSYGQDQLYLTKRIDFTDHQGDSESLSTIALTPNKFVIAYLQGGFWEGRIRIGSISKDSTITLNKPTSFSTDMVINGLEVTRLTNTTFILTARTNSTTTIRVCEVISDDFIIVGNPIRLASPFVYDFSLVALSEDSFLIAYMEPITQLGKCLIGKVKDVISISLGPSHNFTLSSMNNSTIISLDTLSSTKFVIAYGYDGGTALIGSIEANGTIAFGNPYRFSTEDCYSVRAVGLHENQFALVYTENYWDHQSVVQLGTTTEKEISFSQKFTFHEDQNIGISATKLSADRIVIGFDNISPGGVFQGNILLVDIHKDLVGFSEKITSPDMLYVNGNKPVAVLNQKRCIFLYNDNNSQAGFLRLASTEKYQIVTAVPGEIRLDYSIFPNPTKDFINIKMEKSSRQAMVKLYNVTGKIFYKEEFKSATRINISNYPKGTYLLQINDGKKIRNSKIIVE
ncbi:hypothetical protein AHMF7605_22450 [Adhaeribacter arboris]|uniref:Secretion system C-terminal sorting domain-containing protein n=1 Tax=Adhaeribacter arboris TaxID=2072846 RepID=A0A2T2YKN0_9BACT|nr:T9SS type A sorting domain-containing protein [Adhaeribacter arboris]PSR56062.1 hypothetical protein AHMF7605_22450 [Adhaeribacter arboris]